MNPVPGLQPRYKYLFWWLDPRALVFLVLIPVYVLLWVLGVASDYGLASIKGFLFFRDGVAWIGLLGLLALGFGTLSPLRPQLAAPGSAQELLPTLAVLHGIGLASVAGYLYWFKDIFLHPGLLLKLLDGADAFSYAFRGGIERSAGIASLAQLGIPYFVFFFAYFWSASRSALTRSSWALFWAIALFTVLRVFTWAERLALIEIAVVVVLLFARQLSCAGVRGSARYLLVFFPLLAPVLLLGFFGITEYFRSWSSHYSQFETSFWGFVAQRICNYYYAALNTGAGMLSMEAWPTLRFEWTLRWMHKLPFGAGSVFSSVVGFQPSQFLDRYGDPEFNNPCGLFMVFYDLGLPAGVVVLAAIGAAARYTWHAFIDRNGASGYFYFAFLMTLIELFRYLYIGDSRCFMVVAGTTLGILSALGALQNSNMREVSYSHGH